MKICGYCGRENDEAALHCRECGNSIAVGAASRSDEPRKIELAPYFSRSMAGGLAVMLICAGIVVLTRRLLPGIYLLSLSLLAWMVVLSFIALALTLYAGSLCCLMQWNRVIFTIVVLATVALEGALLLPSEADLSSRGSWVTGYCGSGLMIIAGALLMARLAARRGQHPLMADVETLTPGGNMGILSHASSKPAFSVTTVVCVVAGLLALSFLAFWIWVYITPHW